MANPNVSLNAIKRAAAQYGVDWRAMAAIAHHESGLDPTSVGDGGTSYGLFQFHQGGALPRGTSAQTALNPNWNAETAARMIHQLGIGGNMPVEQQIAQISRRFERPRNPGAEISDAVNWFRTNLAHSPGAGAAPTAPPHSANPRVPTQGTQMPNLQTSIDPSQGTGQSRSALLAFLMTNGAMGRQQGVDPNAGLVNFLTQQGQQQTQQARPVAQIPTTKGKPVQVQADPGVHSTPTTSQTAQTVIQQAKRFLGTPYKWGGANPKTGFDCSGFVQWLYAQHGVKLPRTTYQQINVGAHVNRQNLQPGDVVFFSNNGDVHHEGLYLGNGQFIHAPHTGDVIKISSLSDPYYAQQFAGGRRVT